MSKLFTIDSLDKLINFDPFLIYLILSFEIKFFVSSIKGT